MRRTAAFLTGLAILATAPCAHAIDISVRRNDNIIMVCNKETLDKTPEGDIFFHYRKEDGKWIKDQLIYHDDGRLTRKLVGYVTEDEIPTYIEGLTSLYYDPDQNEENLVAIFEENVDEKVFQEWIKLAKEHIKELNES